MSFIAMTVQSRLSLAPILESYQSLIEHKLEACIEQLGPKNALRDACEYALLNGGKRFRSALVLMIAKTLGHGMNVLEAAVGIECFHTASLIADDLPCMDNGSERRNRPTVHRVYGESTALLATYVLISAGYAGLAKNSQIIACSGHPFAHESTSLCTMAFENAAYNGGLCGASGGQFLDLAPPNLSFAVLREILSKKTTPFFEMAFVAGWLFGGGEWTQLGLVKKSAAHFGLAFQIADDLEDMKHDMRYSHSLNIGNILGRERAEEWLQIEIEQFHQTLVLLHLDQGDLHAMADRLYTHLSPK